MAPTSPPTAALRIVCFGQQNWDYCWTAKQQICVRLGRRGHRVLYVDPTSIERPLGIADTLRALAPAATGFGLREVAPNVQVWTHVHAPPLRWRVNQVLRPFHLQRVARRLGVLDSVALAIHPAALPLMDAVHPAARVYYAVDEMTGFHRDPAVKVRMRRNEDLMLRASDAVIGVSPKLHQRFAGLHGNAHLVENAADFPHFSPENLGRAPVHPALSGEHRPTVGLVGQIDERVDQALLVHVARARPGWRIVLAGRVKAGVDVSALEAEPNILLLGYQEYDDLPAVLAAVDVCVVPYHLTPLTHGCNPLKAWEYLATGRPVVATPLNALLPLGRHIAIAEGPAAFLDALDAAITDPLRGREERLEFARRNSWEARVERLEEIFADALDRAAARREGVRTAVPGVTLDASRRAEESLTPRRRLAVRATRTAGRAYYGVRLAARALTGRPRRVRSILVARRSRLGDTVVMLPALRALRRLFPDARIVLGVQRDFSAHAIVDGVVDEVRIIDVLENPSRSAGLRDMARLFADGYDLVLCGASYFMMREAWLTGAPRIAGLDDGRALQALNDIRIRLLPGSHEADNNLAVVEALGAEVTVADRTPTLAPPADSVERAARVRAALEIPADAPVIVMHPGSQKPSRRWPAERFAALVAGTLADRPTMHVVLTGVPGEAGLTAGIRERVPGTLRARVHDAAGRTGLEDLFALLAGAAAFVCNDTGTMHVARALGTPLLALLGPENDRRWGPSPLGPGPAISLRAEVPCAPCVRWDCEPLYCLREVSVAQALDALRDLLDGRVQTDADGRTLERRAVTLDWADLHRRGHPLPRVALANTGAGDRLHPGDDPFPGIERVAISLAGGPAAAAGAVLAATGAPFIAIRPRERAWTREGLGACIATLVRDDLAVAAAPGAGGYREIDVEAALRTGGVVLRRTLLERAAGAAPRAAPADRPDPNVRPEAGAVT